MYDNCMTSEALARYLESVALSVPPLLLLFGACVGHGFLMIVGLNVLYARKLPHELLKYTRKIDLLVIFGGPVLFAYALDLLGTQRLSWEPGEVRFYLSPYVVICWVVGFIVAPLAEIAYLLRRTAPQLVAQRGEIVDIAGVLGFAP